MKKVLGLVVSERRLGNSELLLKEIMKSIPEPCNRELIRLTGLRIGPCRACYSCIKPGAICRIDDDFNFVMNKIKEADALVIGLPVYFFGPHASFKMLSDRMLGSRNYVEHTRGKPCVIVMPFGVPGLESYARAAALALPRVLEMKVVAVWQVLAAMPGESICHSKNLEYAREIGLNLFPGQEFARGLRECLFCGSDLFRLLSGGKVECVLCGAGASLKQDNELDFSGSEYCRFTTEELDRHFRGWLTSMKDKFISERDRLKEVQEPYREMDWWVKP